MVPYYGRHGAKQHIHGKPIRFEYKVWVLARRLGYIVQGEPYQGKVRNISPRTRRWRISADRVEKAPLPEPETVTKEEQGSYYQLTDLETKITFVHYNDNSVFTIASTVAGAKPLGKAKRWSNEHKKHIYVDQPACIVLYKTYMDGVDRLDENISIYRINVRSKKCYWPMIYMLSVLMNNAWLIYRMTPKGKEKKLDCLSFTRYVVQSYMATYKTIRPAAGRPSSKDVTRVIPDVRFSGNQFLASSATQKICGHCGKATRKICETCKVGCHVLCDKVFHSRAQ
ncbi:piggyBac transposable element-derived protein 3-like [Homalodisca vitripennis]|uniref:piggyBac transposable element-derived protein 3-like n=1 Tax=Homalodisca vitripennis TaxID=197043 RepID=UPI001EEA71A3|nr:piggyBac transposable element-derived protein 3-like [Homalodisca vitripennis]